MLSKRTRDLLKKTAKKIGIDISYLRMEKAFKDQRKLLTGKETKTIFDVGASRGQTTAKYLNLFDKAKIYAFEPFGPIFESFKNSYATNDRVVAEGLALSDTDGKAPFYTNDNHYTNSLFQAETNQLFEAKSGTHMKAAERIEVKTKRIDTYCKENGIDHIHILKMDVQGGELKVLQGAAEMLGRKAIDVIYSEVWFQPDYKGQPFFKEIKKNLEKHSYVFYKIYNEFSDKDSTPTTADAIFISPQIKP